MFIKIKKHTNHFISNSHREEIHTHTAVRPGEVGNMGSPCRDAKPSGAQDVSKGP